MDSAAARDMMAGIGVLWATRTRLWGVKDPRKASPEQIEALGREIVSLIRASQAGDGSNDAAGSEVAQVRSGLDLPDQSQSNSPSGV